MITDIESLRDFAARWLWPIACLAVLAGYFGSWVAHPVAGLVVTGLDLGEYVKFLPSVTDGSIRLWRQGFYLPLVVVSLSCSLLCYRDYYRFPLLLRLALIILGFVATLNMLPPAWTPTLLFTHEFILQTAGIAICTLLLLASPLLGLLPPLPVYAMLGISAALAIWFPISGFLKVLPDINYLYNQPVRPGWGVYLLLIGIMSTMAAYLLAYLAERRTDNA